MKFVREDYHEAQQKKNKIISIVVIVFCLVVLVLYLKRKPDPVDATAATEPAAIPLNQVKRTATTSSVQQAETYKDLPSLVAAIRQSIVLITTYDSSNKPIAMGTGFFVSDSGLLVSNRHVFQGANRAEVQTTKGKYSIVKVLNEHSDYDLVRVQVDIRKTKVKPIIFAKSLPQVGEKILVIGNPKGLESSVSDGIVSAVRRLEPFGTVIQITSPISPGSSGSPVLNMRGEVIAVATFNVGGGQNLNFAVPIARVDDLNVVTNMDMAAINFSNSDLVKSMDNPFDQGMLLYDRGEYESAISYLEEAVKKDSRNAVAYMHLGICYRETKRTNAVAAFRNALNAKPDYAEAYCNLGITYIQLNQAPEAIEALREARKLKANYDEAYMYLGIAYNLNKDYTSAINILEKSIEIHPDPKAYYFLGYSYNLSGQHEKAIQMLNHCVEMDGNMVEAYISLGISYVAIEYWEKGIKIMNKAVIIAPQNSQVHFVLGLLHVGNSDLDSAQHEYDIMNSQRADYTLLNKLGQAISSLRYRRRR